MWGDPQWPDCMGSIQQACRDHSPSLLPYGWGALEQLLLGRNVCPGCVDILLLNWDGLSLALTEPLHVAELGRCSPHKSRNREPDFHCADQ